jgi:hypothetical protein
MTNYVGFTITSRYEKLYNQLNSGDILTFKYKSQKIIMKIIRKDKTTNLNPGPMVVYSFTGNLNLNGEYSTISVTIQVTEGSDDKEVSLSVTNSI